MWTTPDSIEVEGRRIPILTDFRAVLCWYGMVSRTVFLRLDEAAAGLLLARMLCLEEPGDWDRAIQVLERFLLCGEEPEPGAAAEPVLDLVGDWPRIWAAFRGRYGIDLDTERMHWWRFRALLEELPADSGIKQIVALRACPPRDPGETGGAEGMERYRRELALRERYAVRWDRE